MTVPRVLQISIVLLQYVGYSGENAVSTNVLTVRHARQGMAIVTVHLVAETSNILLKYVAQSGETL